MKECLKTGMMTLTLLRIIQIYKLVGRNLKKCLSFRICCNFVVMHLLVKLQSIIKYYKFSLASKSYLL